MILDCHFGALDGPKATDRAIRDITGVFETGLFLDRAAVAPLAVETGLRTITRADAMKP